MALLDVFREVSGLMPEVEHHFGARSLPEHAAPPRIVWVPSEDTFQAPMDRGKNPRPLWDRKAGCEVHIWGESFEQIEGCGGLMETFIATLHKVAYGIYELERGRWAGEQDQQLSLGELYILPFSVLVPVTQPKKREATIRSVEETCVLEVS